MPLIVAANRDEFHARPTQKMHWWVEKPDILAGRDLLGGGTWLGVHRNGRFATVTNFRDGVPPAGKLVSRGKLITDFLESEQSPAAFVRSIDGSDFAGFNLIVADLDGASYLSNRDGGCRDLEPGVYGLANATLDTPWPKVERSREAFSAALAAGLVNESSMLRILDDRQLASAAEVETHGLPFKKAHAYSAPFIVMPDYGTRCSTVLLRNREGRLNVSEKRFKSDGHSTGQSDFYFDVDTARS